jgi:hypothetical protein
MGFITGENHRALDYLESAMKGVLDATKRASDVRRKFKPVT